MKRLSLSLLLLAAACQPDAHRLLLIDLTLADPIVLDNVAVPWDEAGYRVEYRQFYPHLTRADLKRYRAIVLLGGTEPQAPSDALTLGDLAILNEWVRRPSGVVIVGYNSDSRGTLDRWVMNQWLGSQGAGIAIGTERVSAAATPLPRSTLDNAGFEPFPAGLNYALDVRDRSQTLARAPASPLVAASRVEDGLVVVASRSLLGAVNDDARTREFLVALARWTRRPAEWAAVRAATQPLPLRLAGGPRPVAVHAPPLGPPAGAPTVQLPQPPSPPGDSAGVSGWIARQGMRVLWSRFTPQALDSLLGFVDLAALNALATVIPVPALDDTIGTRNIWRVTAERMQATSVRWFPSVSLYALASGPGFASPMVRGRRVETEGSADEVDRHGELAPVACGLDSLFWRNTLRPAFRALARLGGARPDVITGVALDLDSAMTHYHSSGFCDADYRAGVAALDLDSAETARLLMLPPTERYDTLLERGLLGRYFEWLQSGVAAQASVLRAELRRLHPDLRFAFHATSVPVDWFSLGLLQGFSTRDAPVLLWSRERRTTALLRRYREKKIWALAAVGLEPNRATLAPAAAGHLRAQVFGENAGFWLEGMASDSLGRVLRRFVR